MLSSFLEKTEAKGKTNRFLNRVRKIGYLPMMTTKTPEMSNGLRLKIRRRTSKRKKRREAPKRLAMTVAGAVPRICPKKEAE